MLKLSNIYKSYGNNVVLRGIDLAIEKGEMVSVMGKSGSGKSTLLNILGLLTDFDKGSYVFNGKAVDSKTDSLKFRKDNIGYILQNPIFVEDRNIFDNILLGINLHNVSREEKKKAVYEISDKLGIRGLLTKLPNEVSGGERQKAAIARAIVYNKPLILADEPTGSLDSNSAKDVASLLQTINSYGTTILIVTHDKDISNYCSRVINIMDGKVLQSHLV